jgi:hypothetical protein
MASTGYSRTTLPQKLGIKEGCKVAIVGAPPELVLGVLPAGTHLQRGLAGKSRFDVLVVFVTRRAELVTRITACRPRMQPAAGLWIAWPKRASGVATDVTEDTLVAHNRSGQRFAVTRFTPTSTPGLAQM